MAILVGAFCWATTHVLAAAPSAGSATGVASARLAVEGMSCASCSVAVKTVLKKLEGVRSVDVNRANKEALVEYEPSKVQPKQLVDAVNKLGYRASLLTPKDTTRSP